jgi:hypothetical protein
LFGQKVKPYLRNGLMKTNWYEVDVEELLFMIWDSLEAEELAQFRDLLQSVVCEIENELEDLDDERTGV